MVLVEVMAAYLSPELDRDWSLFPMAALAFVTAMYSLIDYTCNSRFYFRRYSLGSSNSLEAKNMKSRMAIVAVVCLLSLVGLGLFVWVSCESPVEEPEVRLQLKWIYNSGFAGDLVAKERGIPGMKLDVRAGGIGIDPVKAVTSKAADFGVATGDQLLLAAEQGAPVLALALVYQENPLSWIVREDSGIAEPVDLKGRKVGLTFIDDEPLFQAMVRKVGLDTEDLQIIPVKFDTSPFMTGAVDAYPVFQNTQGIEISKILERSGIATDFVSPSQVGVVSYSNLYFTTRGFAEKNPEVVQAFVTGILDAWRWVQENPAKAAKVVGKFDKENPPLVLEASIAATNRLVKPSETATIGSMTLQGWQSTEDVLLAAGVLKTRIDLDSIYTEKFVK